MSKFDPIRDCPHGRQKGKCDSCDLEQAADFIEQQQQRIAALEKFYLEVIKLLDAAICPCCDKSGAYYDDNGEVCQCQWCDEVNRLPRPPKEQDDE